MPISGGEPGFDSRIGCNGQFSLCKKSNTFTLSDNVGVFPQKVVGVGFLVMNPTLYANIISKPAFVVYVQWPKGNHSTRGCVVTRRVRDGND